MRLLHPLSLLLLTMGLLLGACQPEPALVPAAPDAPKLLSRRVTVQYHAAATPATAPALDYQGYRFYQLTRSEETFQYDSQRRLTLTQRWNPDRPDYAYERFKASYAYNQGSMIVTNYNVSPLSTRTYPLNSRGYVSEYNTYDPNDYLTTRQESNGTLLTQTIVGGNIVKQVKQDQLGRWTTTSEYDLSKAGLPDPGQVYRGRASRNLLIKQTLVGESFTGVAPVLADHHVTTYTYAFDDRGLAIRQRAFTERSLQSAPANVERSLAITDFEYQQ